MDYTTLHEIRENSPCEEGWQLLLATLGKTRADKQKLSYAAILDSNGIEDAVWCLNTHDDFKKVRLFVCDMVQEMLNWMQDKQKQKLPAEWQAALAAGRAYAKDELHAEDLEKAEDAAYGHDASLFSSNVRVVRALEALGTACSETCAEDISEYVYEAFVSLKNMGKALGDEDVKDMIKASNRKIFEKYFCKED